MCALSIYGMYQWKISAELPDLQRKLVTGFIRILFKMNPSKECTSVLWDLECRIDELSIRNNGIGCIYPSIIFYKAVADLSHNHIS